MQGDYRQSFPLRVLCELFRPANEADARRPVRRWIRKLCLASCFVLFLIVFGIWATGFEFSEHIVLPELSPNDPKLVWSIPIQRAESLRVYNYRGPLTFVLYHEIPYPYDYNCLLTPRSLPGLVLSHNQTIPFVELSPPAPRSAALYLSVSDWWLLSIFGLPPISAFVAGPLRRALKDKPGHCRKCGYCLTGLVEHRCPECGTGFSN